MTEAVASTSLIVSSDIGLFGFVTKPNVAALGTNSCNSASPLAPSSPEKALKPVRLPPGRLVYLGFVENDTVPLVGPSFKISINGRLRL